ncbi:unnamed protein product, partial [Laminaria digitata]
PLGRPENRARKEKKPGSDHWEPSEMAKAAIHFHVIGTVVVVQPEVFNRSAMMKDDRHTVKDAEGNTKGVRMMCP